MFLKGEKRGKRKKRGGGGGVKSDQGEITKLIL